MPRAYLTQLARANRQAPTPAEAALWDALRRNPFDGVKFKRQQPIDRYIVDFCAIKARVVIELDGAVHDTPEAKEYDAIRDQYLLQRGFTVLRFRNETVLESLPDVLEKIREILQGR
jgi:very-short-patch-repair endonuclease